MRKLLERWDPFKLGSSPRYKNIIMVLFYILIVTFSISLFSYFFLFLISDRNHKLSLYSEKERN